MPFKQEIQKFRWYRICSYWTEGQGLKLDWKNNITRYFEDEDLAWPLMMTRPAIMSSSLSCREIIDAMDMTEEEKQQDNRFGEFFAHQAIQTLIDQMPWVNKLYLPPSHPIGYEEHRSMAIEMRNYMEKNLRLSPGPGSLFGISCNAVFSIKFQSLSFFLIRTHSISSKLLNFLFKGHGRLIKQF